MKMETSIGWFQNRFCDIIESSWSYYRIGITNQMSPTYFYDAPFYNKTNILPEHKFGKCVIYTIFIHVLQIIFVSNVVFVISQYCLVVFFLYKNHRAFVKSQIPIYDITLRFCDIDFVISPDQFCDIKKSLPYLS